MDKRTCIFPLLFLSIWGVLLAQETDNIGTETVTVVKPYSPTVSDAFKIKSSPNLNDSIVLQKKDIDYSIFSVPVASTFTPAKGKASRVKKVPPPTLYNTYASLGLGNYNNALLDFYTSQELNRREDFLDVGLNHFSSRGDIDFTPLDTDFYNTKLDVSYQKKDRDMNWGAGIGLQHQMYNWYGIESESLDQAIIDGIDETQHYFNAQGTAHLEFEDSYFRKGDVLLRRFWDVAESAENRAIINSTLELPITEELLTVDVRLDLVNGSFENTSVNNTVNDGGIDYSQFQAGVTPSLLVLRDDLALNLGACFVYGLETENSDSNFFIYPAVIASYRLLEDNVIVYGGIEGQLEQNSYHDFVDENPFVSPTLDIQPTDRQYESYVGLKGQLTSNVGYNVKGSYTAENRKPLFLLNPQNLFRNDEKGYTYGNSFQVFYDDVKTLGIFAELNVDVNRNFMLGINAEFNDYDTETDNPAWNLPSVKGSLFMDYQINDQWYLGANLFYIGEREDLTSLVVENVQPSEFPATILTLDGFFDVNAHFGYRFNEQLSIFIKASNIANNDYQRWANFRVQSFQALAGVSYKFDL
ncbi:TonB-dependent receptor [Muricauda sp. JGD-17]|uniref:TonB-dependent receptor n=1 Tax=Flagellimonas ochracea TaxID=2696472 RepID=A0A964TDS9_9FLAO|nr:TonB-dependent receptor [Allomuricauda ochracea]NAY93072.1 TonB-dependent receptor [Allomuricauda ochracea]